MDLDKLKHLPSKPGAYMMKDEKGEVIYVGKAASLRSRVRSYFQKGQAHTPKVHMMLAKVADVDWIVTDSEVEALMLECNLIKKHHPWYNIRLRDDKHYPYLCVTTSEPFPRVIVTRRVKQDGNRYFGPYADSLAVRDSLRMIRRAFKIRSCGKKLTGEETDRPCLNLHLNQCDSPCSGRISRKEYGKLVADTCQFLEGRQESLVSRLQREMQAASDRLEFERAARLRDTVESVKRLVGQQKAISTRLLDQDILAIKSEGQSACVQILLVRSGRLIGEEHFFLDGVSDESLEFSLGEFIKQYYRDATHIPREILVSHEPPEAEIIEEYLSIKRGSRVKMTRPQRGNKLRLVEMAEENAAMAIAREEVAHAGEEEAEADLEDLRQELQMDTVPHRIEAYDISNIQGKQAVGSMVVFEVGLPAKSQYRRFKIRVGEEPDDYGMMREVLLRRFARIDSPKFARVPDLILIDGGKGQLNAALEAIHMASSKLQAERASMADADSEAGNLEPETLSLEHVAVISIAKRLEEIYVPGKAEPILLPRDSRALRLLQRLRDEAHRFALAYHHKLREKSARRSVLDDIPGVGDVRRKALIRRFGSVAGVKRVSLEELLTTPGINRCVAKRIYEHLHGEE